MSSFELVYITVGSLKEGSAIARTLVQERLAACANIIPEMQSVYRWQGEVQNDNECVVIAKTRKSLFSDLRSRVQELHSYDTPCIVALPIEDGSADYLTWLENETADQAA